jgi:hypothetical protein
MVKAFGAFPPSFLIRPRYDLFGGPATVFRRVPFGGDLWEKRGQGIGHRNLEASAMGTTISIAACPRFDGCLPFMVGPFWALPPDFQVRSPRDLVWCEAAIFGRVPIRDNFGVSNGQGLFHVSWLLFRSSNKDSTALSERSIPKVADIISKELDQGN